MGKRDKESSHHHHPHGGGDTEAQPLLEDRDNASLPCCGCGSGWFMFLIGFFLLAIPWYIAAFILICGKVKRREKPGYTACTIAAVGVTGAIIYGLYRLLPHLIPLIMSLFGI